MCQMKIFLFSQPTNCGKSRSLKLIISGNGWFFIWIIKLPSPDNISGKGGSSFLEMEHDYQWLIHKVKLFAFETICLRALILIQNNPKNPAILRGFLFFGWKSREMLSLMDVKIESQIANDRKRYRLISEGCFQTLFVHI